MTAWTSILNALVAVGAKPFATTVQALRDNPIALTEGAVGAPRIVGAAIKRLADMPVLTVTAADTYDARILSNLVSGVLTNNTATYVTLGTKTVVLATGTIRFKAFHSANDDAAGAADVSQLSVMKNGVEVLSWTTGSNNVERTADIAVVPGDVILWRHRRQSGTSTCSAALAVDSASDSYQERLPYVASSGVGIS